jgi:hypothetical protein
MESKLRFWTISIVPILSKKGGTMDIVQNLSFNYTSPSFVSYLYFMDVVIVNEIMVTVNESACCLSRFSQIMYRELYCLLITTVL